MVLVLGVCLLAMPGGVATPSDATAQTVTLRGRVVALNGASVRGLRLRVVQYGDVLLPQSGEFALEVPANVDAVTIASLDSAWTIVYPPDGRVTTRSSEPVPIMVGEPIGAVVTRALAERRNQSQQLLAQLGVQGAQLGGIEQQMQEIIRLLRLDSVRVIDEASRRARQDSAYEPLSQAVTTYVLHARDLQNMIRLVEPALDANMPTRIQALAAMDTATLRYNASYQRLHTGGGGIMTQLQSNWPEGELAQRDFADFMDNVVERVHDDYILKLNDPIFRIKQALSSGSLNAEYRAARAELQRRNDELAAQLENVERRAERVLEQLRPR